MQEAQKAARPTSAGLLMYRFRGEILEVFLVHPGGPLYAKKDIGVWSIPKGLVEAGEDLQQTAVREFVEETGIRPQGTLLPLGSVVQRSGKLVHAWAFEGEWEQSQGIRSNLFEMEWPPRSGKRVSFPEVDRAAFFPASEAKEKILPAQRIFIDRLEEILARAKKA
ncbi:MAG: NUDIX domain-containing protein [Kiritimatiellia bacterium]